MMVSTESAEAVTEMIRRDCASRSLAWVSAAIATLAFAELHAEAQALEAAAPAIAKAAGWTMWASRPL